MRLDKYLVENKLVRSRTQAQQMIKDKNIKVNGKIIEVANFNTTSDDVVEVINQEHYVSRAAYKLLKAIDEFKINFNDKNILDIGSSTGGFVQVAIEHGANYIYANDVGTNQLNDFLRGNTKIKVLENLNFKDVNPSIFDRDINLITCDVSFISSKIILEKIKQLFNNVEIIILLKPQFEIGKQISDKHKGFVPEKYHTQIIKDYQEFCLSKGFQIKGFCESPILGSKMGNKEYLFYLVLENEK